MDVLRSLFRLVFFHRIDEIIVFHSLTKEEIRQIVLLQLKRAKRTAHARGLKVVFGDSLIEMRAAEGYRPEDGARELMRQIRSLAETRLALAL